MTRTEFFSVLHIDSSLAASSPWLSGVAMLQLNAGTAVVLKPRSDPFVVPVLLEAATRK
jgi:hypothetical protein